MSTHVLETIDVTVPVRAAYDQWAQFESFPHFMDGVERIDRLDSTHTHWKTAIGGVSRELDAVITEQHPDERVAWTTVDGVHRAGVVTFHRLDAERTRVTLQLEYEPEGLVEKIGDAVGMVDRRASADSALQVLHRVPRQRGGRVAR